MKTRSKAKQPAKGSKSSQELIKDILHDLLDTSPFVKASAVVKVSGLTVVSVMPPYMEEERVSAMAAVMLLLGERITRAMKGGPLDKVYIKGEDGHIVLMSVGQEAVLTVMAGDRAPLGLLFVEMRLAAEKLLKLM